ncbi:hypothetical protein F4859DRAFT_496419 [Xylaria cf. heliscus]|nr:hypothetical protein F4859DRAFT_496419 [Xylaria cf. heliscus]
MSTDTESTLIERLIDGAERYCIFVSSEYTDPATPTVDSLNEVTDEWIRHISPEVHSPSAAVYVCMVVSCCLNDDWLSQRFGYIFWNLGFDGVTTRQKLFEYLLWRFEKYADACQDPGVSDRMAFPPGYEEGVDYSDDVLNYSDDHVFDSSYGDGLDYSSDYGLDYPDDHEVDLPNDELD